MNKLICVAVVLSLGFALILNNAGVWVAQLPATPVVVVVDAEYSQYPLCQRGADVREYDLSCLMVEYDVIPGFSE